MPSLRASFDEHFEVLPADSPELLEAAYRLRYRVYCQERGFEDALQFPDGLERDRYDRHAAHSLLRHKLSGQFVGAVRLIRPDPDDPSGLLPIEQHAGGTFDLKKVRPMKLPRRHVAEISRLAITRCLHVGQEEEGKPAPSVALERQSFPHLVLGLFMAILRMTVEHDITYWYALMEPALARLLQRYGIYFEAIGPVVEHRGLRRPYFSEVDRLLAGIYRNRPEVWEMLTDAGALWPAPAARGRAMKRLRRSG